MKLSVNQELKGGTYKVSIQIVDFTEDELTKIASFGAPTISVGLYKVYYGGAWVYELPLNDFDYVFQFDDKDEATKFIDDLKKQIKLAAETLRKKTDNFTKYTEYEF